MQPSASKAKLFDRCAAAQELLPAYVARELGAAEAERVRTHLSACGDCRREEARYRAAFGAFASREPVRPGDLYPGFAAKLARQSRPSPARQLRGATAGACAILAVAAGAVVVTSRLSPSPVNPNQPVVVATETPLPPPAQNHRHAPPAPVVAMDMPNARASEQAAVEPDTGASADVAASPPAPKQMKRRAHPIDRDAGSFLDVRPQVGDTARQQIRRRLAAAISHTGPSRPTPLIGTPVEPPDGVVHPVRYVPALSEQIRVGDRVSRVKGDAGLDAGGHLAVIRVTAETSE